MKMSPKQQRGFASVSLPGNESYVFLKVPRLELWEFNGHQGEGLLLPSSKLEWLLCLHKANKFQRGGLQMPSSRIQELQMVASHYFTMITVHA